MHHTFVHCVPYCCRTPCLQSWRWPLDIGRGEHYQDQQNKQTKNQTDSKTLSTMAKFLIPQATSWSSFCDANGCLCLWFLFCHCLRFCFCHCFWFCNCHCFCYCLSLQLSPSLSAFIQWHFTSRYTPGVWARIQSMQDWIEATMDAHHWNPIRMYKDLEN